MAWRVAESLLVLRKQVDQIWPNRSKDSDGTIGDAAHATRASDHNPWVKDGLMGVVTAMDITHDPKGGFDSYAFADMLRDNKDSRIKYIISNRRIANSLIDNWAWRPYNGANPHDHHVHISVKADKAHFDNDTPWKIDAMPSAPPIFPHPEVAERAMLKIGSMGEDVKYLQRMLGVEVTGMFDIPTETAVKEFQRRYQLLDDGKVGFYTWRQLEA